MVDCWSSVWWKKKEELSNDLVGFSRSSDVGVGEGEERVDLLWKVAEPGERFFCRC